MEPDIEFTRGSDRIVWLRVQHPYNSGQTTERSRYGRLVGHLSAVLVGQRVMTFDDIPDKRRDGLT